MSLLAIELCDVDLVSSDGRDVRFHGPGIALLDPSALLLGAEAAAQARLRPRRVMDRYWSELSTQTLPHPTAYATTYADLAFAQLEQLWQDRSGDTEAVILVVPAGQRREALGLILGMAQELSMPVQGVVDAAVAGTTLSAPGSELFHLDFGLHRATLSRFAQGHLLTRGDVVEIPEAGVARIRTAWVAAAAEAFVRQTRFDPLHEAASEQHLHDALHGWLDTIAESGEAVMAMDFKGEEVTATLTREAILRAATPAYRAILAALDKARIEGRPVQIGVATHGRRIMGLGEALESAGRATVLALEAEAAVHGALGRKAAICASDGDIRYVTALPALGVAENAEREAPPVVEEHAANAPTHLLLDAHAFEIGAEGLVVGTRPPAARPGIRITGQTGGISRQHCVVRRDNGALVVEDQSRYGTFVNGDRVQSRQALKVGDHLRVGSPGRELLAITIAKPGGPDG